LRVISSNKYEELEKEKINPLISQPSQAVINNAANPSKRDQAVKYIQEKGVLGLVL
jgi:hypothetical protein